VYAIYEDKESRKWMGTLKGGIDIMDGQKNRFQTIAHNPLVPNSLVNNFVSTFFEDKDRNLWIGTDGGGMSIWNRRQNHFTNFQHNAENASSLSNNSITSIRQDHMNDTWIATGSIRHRVLLSTSDVSMTLPGKKIKMYGFCMKTGTIIYGLPPLAMENYIVLTGSKAGLKYSTRGSRI
jgi:ligand-binding sensor domain-containing protein